MWIYGYDFQKFSRSRGILLRNFSGFMGILLRKFSGFMGGTFTIRMAQPRILESQVTPPPPVVGELSPRKLVSQQNPLLQTARSCEKDIFGSCTPPWMPSPFITQVYESFGEKRF